MAAASRQSWAFVMSHNRHNDELLVMGEDKASLHLWEVARGQEESEGESSSVIGRQGHVARRASEKSLWTETEIALDELRLHRETVRGMKC